MFCKIYAWGGLGICTVLAFDLAGDCYDMTLHSDGPSKKGWSSLTFDAKSNDCRLYVLGLWEAGAADAQSQLDVFCDVLEEVCKTTGDGE